MAVWKLAYNQPYEQNPFLFYAAFGGAGLISQVGDWSGTLHENLQVSAVEAGHFRCGVPWDMVVREQPGLAARIIEAETAIVIKGSIAGRESLDYLRETIELLSYLLDQGACGVYDPFALAWWSVEAWEDMATQGGIFNPFDHVALLASPEEEDGLTWLHTRGLRKFGRPDLSVHGVLSEELEAVQKMLDRFINYQALGGVIEAGRAVVMKGLESTYRPGAAMGDLEDPDFNNFHVEIVRE